MKAHGLKYNHHFTHRANKETGMRDFYFKPGLLSDDWKKVILENGGIEIKGGVKSIDVEVIPESACLPYPPPGQAYTPPMRSKFKNKNATVQQSFQSSSKTPSQPRKSVEPLTSRPQPFVPKIMRERQQESNNIANTRPQPFVPKIMRERGQEFSNITNTGSKPFVPKIMQEHSTALKESDFVPPQSDEQFVP